MISNWMQAGLTPFLATLPGYRYKQTSTTPINDGSPVLDGQGYVIGANIAYNRFGSAIYVDFNYDPTKGDIFATTFTRTINPTEGGTSSNITYGSGQSIVNSFVYNGSLFFQGESYVIGALTASKIDISYVLNFTTKTVKLLYSTTVGGPKTLLAEKPFVTVVASNALRFYFDNSPSAVSSFLVYNNAQFAL
ncbi:hypothetical protein D3C75_552220 [compost metagenome]